MTKTIRDHLVDIVHLAETFNARQHAGLNITPMMWSKMYQACNEAKAALQDDTVPDSAVPRTLTRASRGIAAQ